ncbi:protein phosphatase 2C domain-containing protein [Candidatus Parabeggiatoa sp. HSG14]|uniref:PP2C family protein-serine/threonine phosphatase n=1 Tax=Candidatus Parabeggiatoa sp. HSG14 TaxID=3055593 RepID=UPI0025A6B5EF|nr:protein phosphatase 2C domain-containing protein [Thiotrichales bacterium HSG14]
MAKQFLIIDQDYTGDCIQGERHYQEDYFEFYNDKSNDFLMVLADGMGGHRGGDYASRCATQSFINTYHAVSGKIAVRLYRALQKANHQLALDAQSKPELRGMGCTLVGVAINKGELEWISIGDSPLWLYRAKHLHRLNADHSMKPFLEMLVQQGQLSHEEAAIHPDRNMLRSALAGTPIEMIDQSSISLKLYPGDRILLASDGILTLSELEIGKLLNQPLPAKTLVKELLSAVQKKGKPAQDNTTALVVEIPNTFKKQKKKQKALRWQMSVLLLLLLLSLIFWISVRWYKVDILELIEQFSQVLMIDKTI